MTPSVALEFPLDGKLVRLDGKPIIGGLFGFGQYVLIWDSYFRYGRPRTRYAVVERTSSHPLTAFKESASEALAEARASLEAFAAAGQQARLYELWSAFIEQRRIVERAVAEQTAALSAQDAALDTKRVASMAKKRRAVFDASGGKCAYCSTTLQLAGGWHVEHKTPRSKGGTNAPDNLVASCVGCNVKKGTKTAEEFSASK
jgi:hypothetical protein